MRRLMYIENKSGGLDGDGRIGWVELSRSGRSYFYAGRRLAKTGAGYKYNCVDEESREACWVSGPRKDGADKLYGGIVQIDEDARVEYWTRIRERPALAALAGYRAGPSTRTSGVTHRNERRANRSKRR